MIMDKMSKKSLTKMRKRIILRASFVTLMPQILAILIFFPQLEFGEFWFLFLKTGLPVMQCMLHHICTATGAPGHSHYHKGTREYARIVSRGTTALYSQIMQLLAEEGRK